MTLSLQRVRQAATDRERWPVLAVCGAPAARQRAAFREGASTRAPYLGLARLTHLPSESRLLASSRRWQAFHMQGTPASALVTVAGHRMQRHHCAALAPVGRHGQEYRRAGLCCSRGKKVGEKKCRDWCVWVLGTEDDITCHAVSFLLGTEEEKQPASAVPGGADARLKQ